MVQLARRRHLKHSAYDRARYAEVLLSFLAERATSLEDTGEDFEFEYTADPVAAKGSLDGETIAADDTVTIGDQVYTFVVALTEVSAEANLDLDTAVNTNSVTIDGVTYTFVTALATEPAVPGEVLVGNGGTEARANLIAAINNGDGDTTTYSAYPEAHPTVTAEADSDEVKVVANAPGVAGNEIEVDATLSSGQWEYDSSPTDTLDGGVDPVPYEVVVGVSDSASLDNLIAAINNDAGEGTTYSTGTAEHPSVTAEAGDGDTMDVEAKEEGAAGNSIATDAELTAGGWDAETLEGGIDTGTFVAADHGLSVGQGPFVASSSGNLPTGLSQDHLYWVHSVLTDDTFTLTTRRGELAKSVPVDAGSGTLTLTKADSESAFFAYLKQNSLEVVRNATDVDDL